MSTTKTLVICCTILSIALIATVGYILLSNDPEPEIIIIEAPTFSPDVVAELEILAAETNYEEVFIAFSDVDSFQSGHVTIGLIASNPNARIFYTTDGSIPTVDSYEYTDPMFFFSTRDMNALVLRAIAVYGNQASEPITRTFFFGNQVFSRFDTLVFSITSDPDGLFCHYNGILIDGILREDYVRANPGSEFVAPDPANFNMRGMDAERPMYMEVFSPGGELLFSQAAGIRTHGGWSRAHDQKSLRLIARRIYSPGDGQFHFDFFPWDMSCDGNPITRYDTLILRNGGNDRYFGILRHELGSSLARNAGFTAVSPVRPAAVFINGEYYGFAWLQVRFNPQYIENLFNTPTRNIDVVGMGEWWFDTEDPQVRHSLYHKQSYTTRDLSNDAIFAQLESIVDIENMMFYYAFQIFMGNSDWPHNNMRRWRYTGPELGLTETADGRWRYIMFDLDWTLGLYGDDYTKPTFGRVLGGDEPGSALLQNILTRPEQAQRFAEIMVYIADNVVNYYTVSEMLDYLLGSAYNEFSHALDAGKYPYWFGRYFMHYNHDNMLRFARYRYRKIFADIEHYLGIRVR